MGNLRSVEKALERAGATPRRTSDHDAIRAADGAVLPGVGAFPKAMRNLRELELDVLIGELLAAGVPMLGICLGMQLLFEASSENEGALGLGLLAGRVERLPAPGLRCRTSAGTRCAGRGAPRSPRTFPTMPLLLRALVRARRRRRATTCSAPPSYGEPFVCAVEREPRLRRPVPPGEVERARPAAAAELHVDLRRGRRDVRRVAAPELYPAIDILGGKAVRLEQGDFERRKEYDDDPLDAARRWVAQGAPRSCTWSISTAPATGSPVNLEHLRADRRATPACRSSTAAGCDRRGGRARRSTPAPTGW